jgi:hypothetical protein
MIKQGRILSLESSASPLSAITFSWMNSLLKTAFKTRLTAASLWALPTRQRARENHRLFTETKQPQKTTPLGIAYRIYMANRKIVWYQFVTAIGAVFFHYANPFFLRKLLNYIQEHHQLEKNQEATIQFENEMGYMYCIAIFGCNVISTLVASQTLLCGRRWNVSIIHMLSSEIYAHALRLKQAHQPNLDNSEEEEEEVEDQDEAAHQQASLISQDTERLAELASYLHVSPE